MLNVFPDLLAFGLFAPLILRAAVGFVFVRFGLSKILNYSTTNKRVLGIIEIIIGGSLIAGFYTQISALAAAIILIGAITIKRKNPKQIKSSLGFLLLLFVVSISLLVSGAGLFAFDLPL